jgi:hypothetical protein
MKEIFIHSWYSPYVINVGQVLELYDTPETRSEKAWYFERNYHHYFYKCERIIERLGYNLVVCTALQKKEGLVGSSYLDDRIKNGNTSNINMASALLKPVNPSNRMYAHLLTKLEED